MSTAQRAVEELSRAECLELLQTKSRVGRLAFVVDGCPLVLPVNYVADANSIVFCTSPGTKLSALRSGPRVAFEVDDSRELYHAGWSVLVQGKAREVRDPEELDRLRRGPLWSWAVPSSTGHWVSVSIDVISGRRIPETGRYPGPMPVRG
ncbi:MAG: pyridoxamine 5'-phosphate oxidase family protein [Chloroflexi bacterium]|nr:MAG: pyridoxamine 5'-phosphate oxidase family protein [Chloroflexota bacterium]